MRYTIMFSRYIIAENEDEAMKIFEKEFVDNIDEQPNIKTLFEVTDQKYIAAHGEWNELDQEIANKKAKEKSNSN